MISQPSLIDIDVSMFTQLWEVTVEIMIKLNWLKYLINGSSKSECKEGILSIP